MKLMKQGKHMKQKTRLLVFLLWALILSTASVGGYAAEDDLQKKMSQTKQKLTQIKVKEKSVLGKLITTQKELDKISSDVNKLSSRLGNTEKRISVIRNELEQAEDDLEQVQSEIFGRETVLNQRLVSIYKYGYQSYLEILFQAKNFGDFISRYEMVGNFVHTDLELLKRLQLQMDEIARKKQLICEKQSELEREKNVYAKLHNQTKLQQGRYLSKVEVQREELQSIQSDRKKLEAALDELERLSKEMESQIRDSQNKNRGVLGSGSMIWPVSSRRITSPFGYRVHPILKKKKNHTGIDIAASRGTPIYAADSGVVMMSRYNGGYGKMISIDHGNGISTLYGHCDALLVAEEQRVEKGQQIGLVGSTGLSTGPHLHFEVRKSGVPVNPMNFL